MIKKIRAYTKGKNIHSSGPKAAFSYTQETTLKPPAFEVPSHPQSTESHLLPLTSASAAGTHGSLWQLSTCQMKCRCPGTAMHTHTSWLLQSWPALPVLIMSWTCAYRLQGNSPCSRARLDSVPVWLLLPWGWLISVISFAFSVISWQWCSKRKCVKKKWSWSWSGLAQLQAAEHLSVSWPKTTRLLQTLGPLEQRLTSMQSPPKPQDWPVMCS